MSGGSYDYLCYRDATKIREYNYLGMLEKMAEDLAALGYAKDAAKETTALLLTLRQQEVLVQTYIDRLSPLWKAMEWWHSGDWDEESVKDALAKYRGEKKED